MKRWFILIVALQALFIAGEATIYAAQVARGQVVTLRVLPVDPRSLFMGNYMALEPAIVRLDLKTLDFRAVAAVRPGDPIFVAVRPEPAGAVPIAASPDEEYARRGTAVVLRGTVTDVSGPPTHPTRLRARDPARHAHRRLEGAELAGRGAYWNAPAVCRACGRAFAAFVRYALAR